MDVALEEDDRIDHLAVGDPSVALHAGFTTRIVSLAIDVLLLLILGAVLVSLFWLVSGVPPNGLLTFGGQGAELAFYWSLYALLVISYSVILGAAGGQTFGKQAMRIVVVGKDGKTPSINSALTRSLGSFVSLACLGAGFIAIIKDPEKQAWHDRWSNTYVISLDEATERL